MINLLIENRTTKALQEKIHGIYVYSLITLAIISISKLSRMDIYTINFVFEFTIKTILEGFVLSILFYYLQIRIPQSSFKEKEIIDIIMAISFFILSISLSFTLLKLYLFIVFL